VERTSARADSREAAPRAQTHQVHGGRLSPAAQQVDDDLLAASGFHVRVRQRGEQLLVAFDHPGDAEELVLHLVQRVLGRGDGEERRRVGADAVGAHDRDAPTWSM
jgi:hypothetical protein